MGQAIHVPSVIVSTTAIIPPGNWRIVSWRAARRTIDQFIQGSEKKPESVISRVDRGPAQEAKVNVRKLGDPSRRR